jgi:hypothetical protein
MENGNERQVLDQVLNRVRRKLLFQTFAATFMRSAIFGLPAGALAVAIFQRTNQPAAALWSVAGLVGLLCVISAVVAFRGLGQRLDSALRLDSTAGLKDRITSAYEFLNEKQLGPIEAVQVSDAVRHAKALDVKTTFRFAWPRYSSYLPVAIIVLAISFLIPPMLSKAPAKVAMDAVKQSQLAQLRELQDELQNSETKELQDELKKLQQIKKQFEKGEISERDMMLQLGRLDENLRQKISQMGVENLESEMNTMVPHLASAAATAQAAEALKENKLDKAAEELQKLADKINKGDLPKDQQKQLAATLGVCASKLGNKDSGSFGKDCANASDALQKSDSKSFASACKSMCNKLGMLKKCQSMKSCCNKIGMCKSCMGQCNNKELGFKIGQQSFSKGKGGLKAGTSTAGNPLGDANRLADWWRKTLNIAGEAGTGPVETETEVTEGQLSQSQTELKNVQANYAAAAEEVIEKEDIPLSHRYHVKRYFQSIRPQD